MIIKCTNCGKKYRLDSEKIQNSTASIKCQACGTVFEIKRSEKLKKGSIENQAPFPGQHSSKEHEANDSVQDLPTVDLRNLEEYLGPITEWDPEKESEDPSDSLDLSELGHEKLLEDTDEHGQRSDEKHFLDDGAEKVALPLISPASGKYNSGQRISITCDTPDAEIYFTRDGSEPTTRSRSYSEPIELFETTNITARAFKPGWKKSLLAVETFEIVQNVGPLSFSLKSGRYASAQTLEISCGTLDADIHFTSDGSEPSQNSPSYKFPIAVTKSVTILAQAFKKGWVPSKIEKAIYDITGKVADPTFYVEPGAYSEPLLVNIFCPTPGAEIHFTTDKNEPTKTMARYIEPIEISKSTVLSARAFKKGWTSSEVVTGIYEITGKVRPPVFSLISGIFTTEQRLEMSCPTSDAQIHYTVDGTPPTLDSSLYSRPLKIKKTVAITARAFKDGWAPSTIRAANYKITGKIDTPKFSVKAGKYITPQQVTITCVNPEASIYYTTDGHYPSEGSIRYSGPIKVDTSTVIKARSFLTDWEPSDEVEIELQITGTVLQPVFSLSPGIYKRAQTLSISSVTLEVRIFYTLDGTEPMEDSPEHTGAIELKKSATITARAFKTDWAASDLVSGFFEITGTMALPKFSLKQGTYVSAREVVITCATPGASVHYTNDGTNPTEDSPLYSGSIHLTKSAVIKARAFRTDWKPSEASEAEYQITGTVAPPLFSLTQGTYTSAQILTISCSTPGSKIHYTLDDSKPSEDSLEYTEVIEIDESTTVNARAFKKDWTQSDLVSVFFQITGTVAKPELSLKPGNYATAQSLTMTCATPEANIHYTSDGTEPTEDSILYLSAVYQTKSTVIKARAFRTDWQPSEVSEAEYHITGTVAPPLFSLTQGTYTSNQTLTINCATPGAKVFYTMDGLEPSEGSTEYTGGIELKEPATITARAFKEDWTRSVLISASFQITGTLAKPEFSLESGTYTSAQSFTITCATPGANIHYTADKAEPTENSILYSGAVYLTNSSMVKARAFRTDWDPSEVAEAEYRITGKVEPPVFSLSSGKYNSAQTLTVSCPTNGAKIYYALDDEKPTEDSLEYTGEIELNKSVTINARAFRSDWTRSVIVSAFFEITGRVAAPELSLSAGKYAAGQSLTITCATPEASIHYTFDGTEPTEDSVLYPRSILISKNSVIKVRAFRSDWQPSEVVEAEYLIMDMVSKPAFSLSPGTYETAQTLTLSCLTPEVRIYYTLDGTEPTEDSLEYSEPIELKQSTTVTARAFKSDWAPSDLASAFYEITGTVASPEFSLSPGTYTEPKNLEITCPSPEAVIHYTTDGSEPTQASRSSTEVIRVDQSMIISARVFRAGWAPSEIVEAAFVITGTVAPPEFSLKPDSYTTKQVLFISCPTSAAEIRYTTDKSEPTEDSPVYSGSFELGESTTITARAFKKEWEPSPIISAVYEITGRVAIPEFSLKPGAYSTEQTISLKSASPDSKIFYTADKSEPTENSIPYNGPIILTESVTISARAYRTGWESSEIAAASYEISRRVAAPVFSVAPGKYDTKQMVAIECDTEGAEIFYSADGSDPTEASTLYKEPIEVTKSVTISVLASKAGWESSERITGVFNIVEKETKPVSVPKARKREVIPKQEEVLFETPVADDQEEVIEVTEVIPIQSAKPGRALPKKKTPTVKIPPKPARPASKKRKQASGEGDKKSRLPVIKGPYPDTLYVVNEEEFRDGEEIINEKSHGEWFWVVLDGEVEVIRETPGGKVPIVRLGVGAYPGALVAVLSTDRTRSATTVAAGDVQLGIMDIQRISMEISFLSKDFRLILESMVTRLAQVTSLAVDYYTKKPPPTDDNLKKAKPLIKMGQKKAGLFKIQQGNAYIVKYHGPEPIRLAKLGPDEFFGQIPFLDFNHEPMGASVLVSPDIKAIEIDAGGILQEYDKLTKTVKNIFETIEKSLSITTQMAFNYRNSR